MIAPDAIVSNVHPALARSSGSRNGTVHVDDSALEEVLRLLRPHSSTRIVEDTDQCLQRYASTSVGEATEGLLRVRYHRHGRYHYGNHWIVQARDGHCLQWHLGLSSAHFVASQHG